MTRPLTPDAMRGAEPGVSWSSVVATSGPRWRKAEGCGSPFGFEADPHLFFDGDADVLGLRVASGQELCEILGVGLEGGGGGVARDGVDGIFHGVGGHDAGVVAVCEAVDEVAAEINADGPFAEFVAVGMTEELEEAHPGFSVVIFGEVWHGSPRVGLSGAAIGGVAEGTEEERDVAAGGTGIEE